MHTHQINGIEFIIDPYTPGQWFWSCDADQSQGDFPTQADALQDAMRYVREKEQEERDEDERRADEAKYGTYEDQVREYWKSTRL